MFYKIFVYLVWLHIRNCHGEISVSANLQKSFHFLTDKAYASMPELFHLDDFDRCMLLQDEAIYCTFSYQLKPLSNDSLVWNIIKNVTSDSRNYRHDILRHGICLPTTCNKSVTDLEGVAIESIVEECYDGKFHELDLSGNISNLKCTTKDSSYPISFYDVTIGVLFASYIALLIFASIYEGLARYQKPDVYDTITSTSGGKLIAAFSLPNNWYRLTTINENSDAEKLRSIQGIRFYNMVCVILCHTITVAFAGPISNTQYTESLTDNTLNMFIANGNYVVQTFFVISGWLLSFHFFEMLENRKEIRAKYLLIAFLNRYFRLTPTLAAMIAFETTWFVHLGNGPNWEFAVADEYRNCRKNWWTNLLYINNYIDKNHMCLHQTWYIASDTQLYMMSLLLLMIMWKYPKYIKVILGIVIVTGMVIPGVIAFVYNYEIIIKQYPETMYNIEGLKLDSWHDLYSSGYSSITGYTIGITFGYMFYKYRHKTLIVKRIHVILWWILTFGMCNFVILIASVMYRPDYQSTRLESALYWAFGKNLFALGLAIAIFGFTLKIGWFPRWFCEWRAVQVLGRLTYSTYIVHVPLIRLRCGFLRTPLFVNDYTIFTTVLGDIVLSYLAGTLMCLCLEMPVSALQKLMVPQLRKQDNTNIKQSSEKSLETLDLDDYESRYKLRMSITSKV